MLTKKLSEIEPVKFVNTGIRALDAICKGWPSGRIVEIFGEESTGKSTLVYTTMLHLAAQGFKICLIDLENSIDNDYIQNIAKNMEIDYSKAAENINIAEPEDSNKLLKSIAEAFGDKEFDVIILDSIAALVPPDEGIGAHARMFTNGLRKIAYAASKSNGIFLATNQVRYAFKGMVAHKTTTGGHALKHYSSLRIALVTMDYSEKMTISKMQIHKSKVSMPFKEARIKIVYGAGIDQLYDKVELKVLDGTLERKGNMYIYKKKMYKLSQIPKIIKI